MEKYFDPLARQRMDWFSRLDSRIHKTLKMTPAMAAGVTLRLWKRPAGCKVLEDWEAARAEP